MMIEALFRLWDKVCPDKPVQRRGCLGCGTCCEHFGGYLHASDADLERWRQLGRHDLLEMVNSLGWIWVDPKENRRGGRCPFLKRIDGEKAHCAIHDIKPDICREYPSLDHGRHCVRGIYIPRDRSTIH
ncbi:YkgJ family cysteine cluster protein [Geoalkalibacter halelectricus]|uniref:YkgJ family cysteine cluster protein n=1 Tax=Geoalkalibacter halelectricus TaxID=2847045 RepID=A0ABY5ZGM8_9BACT|nr:YkgJ family cysteine cluster protein [Geoalkalibacter halelectricus]MDO3380170.1 YkgJ family cysteine cluster protein [Geoalkalibacter halelectricus]UWZ78256.1 YkgJ family cysteine cluster protein [Geoalkalibacter halelectricus]